MYAEFDITGDVFPTVSIRENEIRGNCPAELVGLTEGLQMQ
jgi:hypothetical protein